MSGSRHKLNSITHQLVSDCTSYILDELEESMGARVTYSSPLKATIKFTDTRVGSLSISAEATSPDYLCRWNIYTGECKQVQGKWKSHWYDIKKAHEFVDRVQAYLDTILANNGEAGTQIVPDHAPMPEYLQEVPGLDSYEGQS
jgi:hypothetical protein